MRLFSLLPMILAAIFFAGSVSAHHKCNKNHDLGGKVYQVCKSWRADQGGPMPDNMMQHCRNVLCQFSEDEAQTSSAGQTSSFTCRDGSFESESMCVNDNARANAKNELGYW